MKHWQFYEDSHIEISIADQTDDFQGYKSVGKSDFAIRKMLRFGIWQ